METDKIKFTKDYDDTIHLNMEVWTSLKSSQMGIVCDILNNLPLQAYNYQYKFHTDLSILSIMFNPIILKQGIDKVLGQVRVYSGFPKEYTGKETIVHSKKDFAKFIFSMRSNKTVYCVLPSDKKTLIDNVKFSRKWKNIFQLSVDICLLNQRRNYQKLQIY